ncbi:MAG TPA: serine/threonine-protein kinase [Rugosimonospora sp.]
MTTVGGRYRLVERLGVGGMSLVWRAFDEVLGRQVAIKVLAGDYAASPDFRRAIRREARAVARLAHPNIGVVYDYGEWPDRSGTAVPYVVMELIEGPTLSDQLRSGTLSWSAALGICAQVAAALGAAHARGLVHRDVKPANIMLAGTGVKVVDFGISALIGEQVDLDGTGIVQGTPSYVAPERLCGAPVGAAADLYALGVVLFQALAGRLPWHAEGEAEILTAHLTARPDPLPPIPGMPDDVNDLYLRCLAKDPAQRPDAREVAVALAAAAGPADAMNGAMNGAVNGTMNGAVNGAMNGAMNGGAGAGTEPGREPTTLLPSAGTMPIALAGRARVSSPASGTRSLRAHRRRRIAGLALLPLALIAGVFYLTTTEDHDSQRVAAATGAEASSCAVTYRVGSDNGATFTGTLTLRTPQSPPPGGWTLSFDLPADQTFQVAAPAASIQNGEHVLVRVASPGASGGDGSVVVPFTGSYRGTNPLPAAFVASGHSCTPLLLGPDGVPSAAAVPSTPDGQAAAGYDGDRQQSNPGPPGQKPAPPGHEPGHGGKPGKG